MSEHNKGRRRYLLNSVCVLMSAHFALAYNSQTSPMVPFGHYKELDGSGGPFAYRMLPALLWKAGVWVFGPISHRFSRFHFPNLNKPLSSSEDWFMVLLTFAAMLGTLLIARRLLRLIDGRPGFEWMALGMGYAAYFDTVLVLNRNLFYPYDVSATFFFMLLVYFAYKGRPVAFSGALLLAMLNKETAIMAVPVFFLLWHGRRRWQALTATCAGMAALAIGVRLAQWAYIRHICSSCHEMAQNQLHENLHQLPNPLFWLSESSVFGFAYVAAIIFWRDIPRRLRITGLVVYGIWLAGMMVVGVMREVRIFSELSALLLLMVASGVHRWLERRAPVAAPLDPVLVDGSQGRAGEGFGERSRAGLLGV